MDWVPGCRQGLDGPGHVSLPCWGSAFPSAEWKQRCFPLYLELNGRCHNTCGLYLFRGSGASLVAQRIKNPPANAGDPGLIPGSGKSPGEGNGNPLQCSCLRNLIDRGTWRHYSPWGREGVRHGLATKQQQEDHSQLKEMDNSTPNARCLHHGAYNLVGSHTTPPQSLSLHPRLRAPIYFF